MLSRSPRGISPLRSRVPPAVTIASGSVTVSGTVTSTIAAITADGTAFNNDTTTGLPTFGVYQSTPDALTDGDMGPVLLDASRRQVVSEINSADILAAIDLLAGALDGTELQVKVTDQTNAFGVHDNDSSLSVDAQIPAAQVWKISTTTADQTGTVIWDASAGEFINITYGWVLNDGAAAGTYVLFFDDDTSYTLGTDMPVAQGVITTTAGSPKDMIVPGLAPITSPTAGHDLRLTTTGSADITVFVMGYIST